MYGTFTEAVWFGGGVFPANMARRVFNAKERAGPMTGLLTTYLANG